VLVGGGLGRTPLIGRVIREFLPQRDLLTYLEAILRVYNQHGRRDNIYKARIKILVKALGAEKFREQVEAEWAQIKAIPGWCWIPPRSSGCAATSRRRPTSDAAEDLTFAQWLKADRVFAAWVSTTSLRTKCGLSQRVCGVEGAGRRRRATSRADQMDAVADLADRYSFGKIRSTHHQNLLLADVRQADLYPLWHALQGLQKLAAPVIGTLADMICCPGLDFCSLANASSISIASRSTKNSTNSTISTIWAICASTCPAA
jgi:sulfite reductase (NADPH) hemoprotein beta-component